MANILEWEEEIKKLGVQEAKDYRDALATLEGWGFFSEAYKNMGHHIIKGFLDREILNKLNKEVSK